MKHLVLLTMIAVLGVPTLAAAADPEPAKPAKPGAVCKDDRKKFCKDIKTTGKKPRDCLLEHKDELSPACKALFDKPKKAKGEGKGKKKKDAAEAPKEGAAPAEGTPPAEGAAPAPSEPTESAPQAEPEVPGEKSN